MFKERFLGLSINVNVIYGFYLLESYFTAFVLLGATFMYFSLWFLLTGANRKKLAFKASCESQEILYWAFPLYPVVSRIYYNYAFSDQKILLVLKEQKSLEFAFVFTLLYLTASLFSHIVLTIISVYYLVYMYYEFLSYKVSDLEKIQKDLVTVHKITEKSENINKDTVIVFDKSNIFKLILKRFIKIYVFVIVEFVKIMYSSIDELFEAARRPIDESFSEKKPLVTDIDGKKTALIDYGDFEIVIRNYDEKLDLSQEISYISEILHKEEETLDDKQAILDNFDRNRNFKVTIENHKLVRIEIFEKAGFERIRLLILFYLNILILLVIN